MVGFVVDVQTEATERRSNLCICTSAETSGSGVNIYRFSDVVARPSAVDSVRQRGNRKRASAICERTQTVHDTLQDGKWSTDRATVVCCTSHGTGISGYHLLELCRGADVRATNCVARCSGDGDVACAKNCLSRRTTTSGAERGIQRHDVGEVCRRTALVDAWAVNNDALLARALRVYGTKTVSNRAALNRTLPAHDARIPDTIRVTDAITVNVGSATVAAC